MIAALPDVKIWDVVESLRLVCLLDCHLFLLIHLSTNDITRDILSMPRMAIKNGARVECMGVFVFLPVKVRGLGGVDGSCESTSGCSAGVFERDLAFVAMETSVG